MAQKGVTLAIVLDHVKGLAKGVHTLERKFGVMEQRMDRLEKKVDEGFSRVWPRFDWVDTALSNIDERLDDTEIQKLPQRVAKLEKKAFAGVDS